MLHQDEVLVCRFRGGDRSQGEWIDRPVDVDDIAGLDQSTDLGEGRRPDDRVREVATLLQEIPSREPRHPNPWGVVRKPASSADVRGDDGDQAPSGHKSTDLTIHDHLNPPDVREGVMRHDGDRRQPGRLAGRSEPGPGVSGLRAREVGRAVESPSRGAGNECLGQGSLPEPSTTQGVAEAGSASATGSRG